jgi:hypothetical protein
MINDLRLTLNAQFYRARATLTDANVREILDAAEANTAGKPPVADAFRQRAILPNGTPYVYSLRVFLSARPVYFVEKPELKDLIHALILILEFQDHVAIFKRSCANTGDAIDECLELVSYADMVSTLDEQRVSYQKLSARQITVADTAIRAKSYEAVDLKGSLSRYATGRAVPYFIRVRDGHKIRSLSLSTGRLFDAAERQAIDAVADWAFRRLQIPRGRTSDFISAFARNVALDDVVTARMRPNSILIDAGALADRMESQTLSLRYVARGNRLISLSRRAVQRVLMELESVYEIDANLAIRGCPGTAKAKINKKNLTFESSVLKRLRIDDNGKEVTLQRFLIANNLYTVTFTNPKYVYTAGACFEDRSGVAAIPALKAMLVPVPALAAITSEKGTFTARSTHFTPGSLFAAVEAVHANEDYLFCDDLGDEWADHLAFDIGQACVTFIHSKHKSRSTSAANLHDIVGQAVKNIGNMVIDPARMQAKVRDKLSGMYTANKVATRISMTRRGRSQQFGTDLLTILGNPRLHRKCVLACSFLSHQDVVAQLTRIERKQSVRPHVIQLMWILSSFNHSVRESNAVPVVYCAP